MAQGALPAQTAQNDAPPKSGARWLLSLAALSLLAIVTGGLVGLSLVSSVEKAVEEKKKSEEEKVPKTLNYSGNLTLKEVPAVVTNLRNSGDNWIRLESAIVLPTGGTLNPDVVIAEIRQDILAYLRTISVEQIQGPSGLQHLREDLNERVLLRTQGAIRELIIETLIIQ